MKSLKLCSLFPFLVLSFLIFSFPLTTSRILFRGNSFSVKDDLDFITSPQNTFTGGFFTIGNTNAYYFGIWFTNSRDKTVVWNAKQDRPVNRQGSKLTLRKNGALVLTDVDDTIVWQTNTTSFDIEKAELLETGNLVLKNPQGKILWQSFDLPTDTLLPHQFFTKNHRLVPPLRKGSLSPGYFSLYFDSDNVLRMIYDGPQVSSIYWPNPDRGVYWNGRTSQNSSRFAYFDQMGRFFSSDRLQFNVSDMGFGILRRMSIDIDGNLRIYSLDNSTGLWKISWQAIAQPCIVHGICGRYSICSYAPEPKCTCPPGYQMVNASDWSRGCRPRFSQRSLSREHVKFVEIPNVDYWGFDLNFTSSMSLESCRTLCLDDPRCRAFVYRRNGEGTCFTKGMLFNGYRSPGFPGTAFLKVPMNLSGSESGLLNLESTDAKCGSSPENVLFGFPSMYELDFKKVKWIYLYLFSFTLGGIEILFVVLGWWALFSKHGIPASIEEGYKMVSSTQFRRFTYTELKKATKNFKIELGRGGSGAVYKGVLADGRAVAVKRLANEFQEEFWAEMTTIGRINHMNLVRMWGFCSEGRHQLLVYEYVENSSLDRHLFKSDILGWKQRFAVALGTAKGLAYLHHECLEWVIHCDVKPENILLDGELEPKIADFGLAKLSQRGGPGSDFTKIRGTKGYMAPEWALNQPITAKVDVYAFGIVILEMVKGSRLSSWVVDDGECDHEHESQLRKFVRMVKRKIQSGEDSWVEKIVDPRLEGNFSKNQAVTLIEIGLSCVEQDRNKRPKMASVVQTLLECEDETTILT
ncbi:putative receptor protein kinase ZmPK1 [Nicotiana tabacum]|uniref:Receptor-like serine/threonine-protein kinase n=1 Tax=Nicotiana tabacum TaxID=4097 RepID=A0A1S3Z9W1_TOBAC|nr:putative receptor protein kinase ZmPK1 [Nicotiana tomentosiformis]XP_016461002.1 PREDICTED: putative receptor protein kinase ZmPK1 [Nicotiana tabacum]